ncbi:hypothetical protein AGMMS49944_32180 [Spirochaetia bacterium]|nr:hypothetical protein AGMMS49944_32180 [Spirochaetia bacterium]
MGVSGFCPISIPGNDLRAFTIIHIRIQVNFILTGNILPHFNNKGLWFLCCFLNIILANQLLTPYFTKPVDSISFSVTGFVTVIMIRPETVWAIPSYVIYYLILIYTTLIVIGAILCIIFKDSNNVTIQPENKPFIAIKPLL